MQLSAHRYGAESTRTHMKPIPTLIPSVFTNSSDEHIDSVLTSLHSCNSFHQPDTTFTFCTFAMKWSIAASIALATLAKASPIDGEVLDLVERAASIAQFATVSRHQEVAMTEYL